MKKVEKIKLLFNDFKLLNKIEELEDIINKQKDVIENLNQELREYELFTDQNQLIARKNDLEYLLNHYHIQKREYKEEIKKLKLKIIELKDENLKLKNIEN